MPNDRLYHAPHSGEAYRTERQVMMVRTCVSAALAAISATALPAQTVMQAETFPRGELSKAKNHTGDIWLNELVAGDATFDPGVAVATYAPGAKLDWHIHPGGQVLLVSEGSGLYQERGQAARVVRKGDVIKSAPGVEHWHGAAPRATFAYIAVTPTRQGKTIWLKPVTDAEYRSAR